jgi:putative membrane-bound dehydrogenase-like protein
LVPGASSVTAAEPVSLFDGRTLAGWDYDAKMWRVENGVITGGSRTDKIPYNDFIATKGSYQNFELKLKIKCSGDPATGMINSGIQIRSVRVPGGHHMSGYQVDCGKGWFGKIYDEFRRNRVIAEPLDQAALDKVVDVYGWNEYRIRAEGPRIRVWINGVAATDFTEDSQNVALDGQVAVQVHSGGVCLIEFKDVTIEELPPTPGAPTWESLGGVDAARKLAPPAPRPAPKKGAKAASPPPAAPPPNKTAAQFGIETGPLTPEEERRAFTVPQGFEVELVAAEQEGIGKFVAIAFDASGRMWTMTALEYPVDANENKAASDALFAKGGRDKVLVYDDVYTTEGQATRVPASNDGDSRGLSRQPRVFADHLVMPLGILPWQDGVFVQYGADIRFYRDTNDDGRADTHDVILTGFGTQDSHLFPHQFTRVPGGFILTAQGLFNYSKVVRPDGSAFADGSKEVVFNQTKLARFTPDGSVFENLTAGPNNIWGLTISREGETWVQEANDLGYPIAPYEPGAHYKTGSKEKLRPYQPLMPPTIFPPQMGGTGLSGLALADDKGSPFADISLATAGGERAKGARLFYLANPITSRIQLVKATPESGRYRYEKLPDFLVSNDPWFRPVAITFGPDGALYIVDWYNKIISHNEVPRAHPDRDKTRGRIWRVRHKDQPRVAPPNLAKLGDKELLAHLGDANARIADLAWQEIVDRKATGLADDLAQIAGDRNAPADRRLGALWALEGIVEQASRLHALLPAFAADPNPNLRHEAVRIAAAADLHQPAFIALAAPLVDDPSPRVRAALGDALRRIARPGPGVIALMAKLGRGPLAEGDVWDKYDRDFERYLARWAMELNPEAVAAFLKAPPGQSLPAENRALATLALGGRDAAVGFARLLPELQRPLDDEEVRTLAAHFAEPAVAEALRGALGNAASRVSTLQSLLAIRTSLDTSQLTDALTGAAKALLAGTNAGDVQLGTRVAAEFQLAATESDLARLVTGKTAAALPAVRALTALRSDRVDLFARLVTDGDGALRDAALAALTASRSEQATTTLLGLWPSLNASQRVTTVDRLASTKPGASALLAFIRSGAVAHDDVGLAALEKMRTLLPGDPHMAELWSSFAGRLQRVLRLKGGPDDFVSDPVDLKGPFTVEAWVKLAPGISNHDGILGAPNQLDMNFHAAQFRVWVAGGQHDIVVASRKATPGAWTHYAVTRDAEGVLRIYLNGELDATGKGPNTAAFTGLRVGRTNPGNGGTDGWIAEHRIWNVARTAEEIRDNFDRSFASNAERGTRSAEKAEPAPAGLVQVLGGAHWGKLHGKAVVEPTLEAPTLLTAEKAEEQAAKFAQFRRLANGRGDATAGKELFTLLCLNCHQQGGKGGQIAPALDGLANTGIEAILRNVLTPNAAMEGGYRKYRVETKDGELLEGLLVSEDKDAIVLRQPNFPDQRIPRSNVLKSGFTHTSLMPEGLLEAMQAGQVSDLFAYLKSLK